VTRPLGLLDRGGSRLPGWILTPQSAGHLRLQARPDRRRAECAPPGARLRMRLGFSRCAV